MRALARMPGQMLSSTWSPDGRWLYVASAFESKQALWKLAPDGSPPEKLAEGCLDVLRGAPHGKYLLGTCIPSADLPPGICGYSLEENSCFHISPAVKAFAKTMPDGGAILYGVSGRGEMIFDKVVWADGKLGGQPEVALKIPFHIPLFLGYFASAFDFTRDLSTIVYARPAGQADLYFLGAKN